MVNNAGVRPKIRQMAQPPTQSIFGEPRRLVAAWRCSLAWPPAEGLGWHYQSLLRGQSLSRTTLLRAPDGTMDPSVNLAESPLTKLDFIVSA